MGIGLIIGSIGTMCSIHYIEQYKFEKHIEVMKNSPDAESVSKSVQELMESYKGVNKVSDYLTEKHDNSIARLAAFDIIRQRLESMNFTIAYNSLPGTVNDVNVRKQSMELLKENFKYSFMLPQMLLATGLQGEKDESILNEKIKLLSKWLFMDENEIQQILSDKGVEDVSEIFKRRIQELSEEDSAS